MAAIRVETRTELGEMNVSKTNLLSSRFAPKRSLRVKPIERGTRAPPPSRHRARNITPAEVNHAILIHPASDPARSDVSHDHPADEVPLEARILAAEAIEREIRTRLGLPRFDCRDPKPPRMADPMAISVAEAMYWYLLLKPHRRGKSWYRILRSTRNLLRVIGDYKVGAITSEVIDKYAAER